MSDKKRITFATLNLLKVLGYSAKAIENFKKGKKDEGWQNLTSAVDTGLNNWKEFKYTYDELRISVNSVFGSNHRSEIHAAQNNVGNGFFTGRWHSPEFNNTSLIFHEAETNAVSLYFPRGGTSEFNIYVGGIYIDQGVLVWTGKNSVNSEIVIVGTPDDGGYNMICQSWIENPETNQMELDTNFELNKI